MEITTRKHQQQVNGAPALDYKIIPRTQHCISKTDISANALIVLNRLERAGFSAYLVGGCIRDLLLRHAPKDFDVVTSARPQQIRKIFGNCRLIGRRFRLAHIYFGREVIEVATFRAADQHKVNQQHKNKSGIIMQGNVYGEIHEDVWRRDFTINSLYYSIVDSTIIDFTGGYIDLSNKIVRLIGKPQVRYQEDPVRMLRAVRHAAKLACQLEPSTEKGIYQVAKQLSLISPARLLNEVVKLYHCGKACIAHNMLRQYGLFELLFPLTEAVLKENNSAHVHQFLENSLTKTDERIKIDKPVNPAFIFAVLLWPPLQQQIQKLRQTGVPALSALDRAMREIIAVQNKHVNIPKRYSQVIREIWLLQFRLPKRFGQRAFRTLTHPRFRAGYDFLLLRVSIGKAPPELADWWTEFQVCDQTQQQEMVTQLQDDYHQQRRNRAEDIKKT